MHSLHAGNGKEAVEIIDINSLRGQGGSHVFAVVEAHTRGYNGVGVTVVVNEFPSRGG